MSRPLAALALGLTLSFGLGQTSAQAEDLVIEGRAAQALQCSAMLFMAANVLYDAGLVPEWAQADAQRAAIMMLDHVPGDEMQRAKAMSQRFEKIVANKTPAELLDDYKNSEKWCRQEFLPDFQG